MLPADDTMDDTEKPSSPKEVEVGFKVKLLRDPPAPKEPDWERLFPQETMDDTEDISSPEETEEQPEVIGPIGRGGYYRYRERKIGVFWNLKDYPVPAKFKDDPFKIYESIKNTLVSEEWRGELVVHAFVEHDDKFPMELRDQYDRARIKISVLPQKNGAKYHRMVFDILSWAVRNPLPSNIFLLSKQVRLFEHFHILHHSGYGGVVSDTPGDQGSLSTGRGDWLLSGLSSNKRSRGDDHSCGIPVVLRMQSQSIPNDE